MNYVILREYILFGTFIWVQVYKPVMKIEGDQGIIADFIYGLGERTKGQYLSRLAVFFDFLEIPSEKVGGRGRAAYRLEMQAAAIPKAVQE